MGLEESSTVRAPSRIVIADDHPLFRSAVRPTLEVHSDLEVVGEAADGREALELCRRLRPELVLMDLSVPQMDGIVATHAIKREFPEIIVLILTALDESAGLSDSLKAGAAAYVLKHSPTAQITDAVRRVLAGESPLNEELAMRLLMSMINRDGQEEGGSAGSSTFERPLGERG
jgi:DNA-binding NarL/FixJ family response regulator